jgi:hypothetical protein
VRSRPTPAMRRALATIYPATYTLVAAPTSACLTRSTGRQSLTSFEGSAFGASSARGSRGILLVESRSVGDQDELPRSSALSRCARDAQVAGSVADVTLETA